MPAARKTSPKPIIAATYCRISSDPFGREAGVDRQRKDVATIARRHGWQVANGHQYVDNDRSASRYARRAREQWDALMAAVEAGEVQALVAYDLDRLLRQPKELERLIDAAEGGLQVATATGTLDLATTQGRTMARMVCTMAAAEADKVSDRMKAKLRHDAANGRPHWAKRPFGYAAVVHGEVVPEGFEAGDVVPSEASCIRRMASMVVDDGLSASEVARRLNVEGITTAAGKLWQAATVKLVLTAPRTAGLRSYNGSGDHQPATWAPILTKDEWQTVCAVLAGRSTGPRGGGRRSMLSKLVRCGRCDAPRPMTRTNTGSRAEWRCAVRPDGGCGLSVSARNLETVVVALMLDALVADSEAKRRAAAPAAPAESVEALQAELDELAAEFGRGEMSKGEWRAAAAPLRARLSAAERQAAAAVLGSPATMLGEAADPLAAWDRLNEDGRRRVAVSAIERVTVLPAKHRGGSFDAGRVSISWLV